MAAKRSSVTGAEREVLEVLWAESPLSAREAFERLRAAGRDGSPQTVRTLLERLLAKEVVERREVHGVWVFSPRLRRDEVVRDEGRSFLRRFFEGRAELGAAYFIEHGEVPEAELRRLKRLLETKLKEKKHD